MIKRKIKAFTILEVTITMLIAGLVIGIAYTSYSIIIKSYHSFTKKNNDVAGLLSLDHLLKRDFEQADTILKDTDGIVLVKGNKTIKYVFDPYFIIRNAARIDTFKVQTQGVSTLFENFSITDLQTIREQNRIDELDFTLVFENEKTAYHYYKTYSSENLIERNPNAVN